MVTLIRPMLRVKSWVGADADAARTCRDSGGDSGAGREVGTPGNVQLGLLGLVSCLNSGSPLSFLKAGSGDSRGDCVAKTGSGTAVNHSRTVCNVSCRVDGGKGCKDGGAGLGSNDPSSGVANPGIDIWVDSMSRGADSRDTDGRDSACHSREAALNGLD
jgi:hypothetical protein